MWRLLWWECTLCRSNVKWTRDWKVQPRRKCTRYYKYGHSRNFWREGSWIRFMDSSIEHVLPQVVYCMASKEQRWNIPKPCRAYCPLWPLPDGMDVLLLDHVDVDVLQRLPHHHHDFRLLFRPAPVQLYTACCGGHPSCTSWLYHPWLCITCLPYLLLPLYSFPSLNCSSRLCSFRTTTVFITTSIDATPLQNSILFSPESQWGKCAEWPQKPSKNGPLAREKNHNLNRWSWKMVVRGEAASEMMLVSCPYAEEIPLEQHTAHRHRHVRRFTVHWR